jgi:hypothetical protein
LGRDLDLASFDSERDALVRAHKQAPFATAAGARTSVLPWSLMLPTVAPNPASTVG